MDNNKIIYFGRVIDNNDPKSIGRIRVEPDTEIIKYVYPENWDETKDKWSAKDPLVFLPLLPYYISQIPLINESVQILYTNKSEQYDSSKFYIQGPISRPWNNRYETYNNSKSVLASGEDLKQSESIIDPETGKVKIGLEGVYPKPGDNSLLGRGSSDFVLVDMDNEGTSSALVRSGKYRSSGNDNVPVVGNEGRAFLQLSSYELENVSTGTEQITTETYEDINTKTYVQWSITNLTSDDTTYNGKISLYSLPTDKENTKVSKINQSIDILSGTSINPLYSIPFTGKTFDETLTLINNFIKGVNDGVINIDGYPWYFIESQFPFFYGPDQTTYSYVIGDVFDLLSNISGTTKATNLYNQVTLSYGYKERGAGLVWTKTPPKLGILTNVNIEDVNKRDYIVDPITYSVMGADKLLFLSHRSIGDYKVNLKDTLYGIPQSKLAVDIQEKTNSMVRGEELMGFLSQIVSFLLNHVHPFPGKTPIQEYPNVTDGPSAQKILQILNNADNVILNQNIRIN
jgi:hypothetical protein